MNELSEIKKELHEITINLRLINERRIYDDVFRKEVRAHIKKAEPLLAYAAEHKAATSKLKTAFFIAIMFAALALLGFNV